MDELREEIMHRLHEMFDEKNPGFFEVDSIAMSITWGIVGVKYPEAPFCEVYEIERDAVQDFCFGEGR